MSISKIHVIAHRGLFWGPNKEKENKPEQIELCIKLGYEVEIDVRILNDNNIYLGHDAPQYKISMEFLDKYKDKLWCHCKNLKALSELREKFNCFSHDKDEYVLTSKNNIWAYPGKPVNKNTIVVLPEWDKTIKYNPSNILGMCTDYPVLYKDFLLPTVIEKELDEIYDEVIERNKSLVDKHGVKIDKDLLTEKDERYCKAMYCLPSSSSLTDIYYDLIDSIWDDMIDVEYCIDVNNIKKNKGTIHFTLMQLIGFNRFNEKSNNFDKQMSLLKKIVSEIFKAILPLKIEYKRVVIFERSIAILGYPDKDINAVREYIRKIFEMNDLEIYEPYKNDIVHSTIFRYANDCTKEYLKDSYVLDCTKIKDNYGSITYDNINIGNCTWKMNKNEIEPEFSLVHKDLKEL